MTYPYLVTMATRWGDNDVYGHVNNVAYYAFFDSAINRYMIEEGGLDIVGGDAIGLVVESGCTFRAALEYPADVRVGVRADKIGNSSVTWGVALFGAGKEPAATGRVVHVFVARATRRPVPIPEQIRAALEKLRSRSGDGST
ncbi:MAG TPA: thioesterase family protein [Kofleriaceae bacterium]|jgi:acyl-CoA thioester hydrolase